VNGIFACQKTFLEEAIWKDVPWEDDLPAKIPFDYLVDVLSDILSFIQQATCISGSPTTATTPPSARPHQILLQKKLLERLETVKGLGEAWHTKYSNPLYQIPPKMTPPASPVGGNSPELLVPPFQTVLYSTDMYRAYDFCIYTTTLILLFMLYEELSHDLDPSLQYPSIALQALFPKISLQSLVRDIRRCTEYMLLDIHGSRGYIVLMFPATVAYFASDKDSSEAKWLQDVYKRHASSSGFGFGDSALDQVTPLSSWMENCKESRPLAYPYSQDLEQLPPQNLFTLETTQPFQQEDAAFPSAIAQPVSDTSIMLESLKEEDARFRVSENQLC